jgi:hypothetical protein
VSSRGKESGSAGSLRLFGGTFVALALLALILFAAPAYAALPHPFLTSASLNGSNTPQTNFDEPCGTTVDSHGDIYVATYGNGDGGAVSVFKPDGSYLTQFTPAVGGGGPCGLAVDSSGVLYINGWNTDVVRYTPSAYPPTAATTYGSPTTVDSGHGSSAVAVDPANDHVFVDDVNHVVEYDSAAHANALINGAIGSGIVTQSYGVDVYGATGNVYVNDDATHQVYVLNPAGTTVLQTIDGKNVPGFPGGFGTLNDQMLAVDQSNGHVYVADIKSHAAVDEFEASGAFVSQITHSLLDSDPNDIAVDNSGGTNNGNVYVTSGFESGNLYAFGPLNGGITPAVAIEPSSEIGVSKVKFNGTINPQSVPNSYHFEWKQGTGTSWAGAQSSPEQNLPEDSTPHAVSIDVTGLSGATTYQVRLIATNTDNSLEAASSPDTFTTLTPSAPAVSIDPPSSIATTSARVSGTVNPEGDFSTTWRLQLSTDPACASGFVDQPLHNLESEAGSPIAVSEKLTGLQLAQHYCVRIRAANGGGATISETEEFETEPVVPDQVETAFVAPRLNTSARLNGRVNPEGAKLTYRFEYSEDGGATWIPLTDREDDSGARKQILVAEELEGLSPDTTYSYRFVAENNAGEASPQGEAKTFTTRTDAEVLQPSSCPNEDVRQAQHTDSYLADCRAIELVNTPDKGNQNVTAEMITENGERALWSVRGGAPGGTASAGNSFLAERTESGWQSRSLVPPPAQQFGEANLPYKAENATPDLNTFVFNAGNPSLAIAHGKTLIRLDREQHQDVLASYGNEVNGANSEISDDGTHVLVVDPDTHQLEDIGNPQEPPETISLMPPPGSPLGVPQPGGTPSGCGLSTTGESFAGWSTGSAAGVHWNPGYRRMAVEDASRVYFETRPDGNCGGSYGLYERNRENGTTTLIDPGTPSRNVELIRATPDGHHAYFATFSQLDPADQNTGADVYRWDEEAPPEQRYTCLTCVVPNADIAFFNGGLLPIMVSDDFSHIYFQSRAQLVPGQGQAGSFNTYALSGGEIRFVAGEGVGRMGVSGGNAGKPGALLSSDGNVLVFRSSEGAEGLTADSLPAQCSVFGEPKPCQELYRYDDRDGSLECISCHHDGETNASVVPTFKFAMSADGSTVAFITSEPLVTRDVNQGLDVYEWRNGTVHLLSDGVRSFQLSFARPEVSGVDADGKNIFFAIVAPGLTGFEQDGLRNLYDTRIGGGFLPPNPPPHCAEDSCQGPLQNVPALSAPASANESAGNVAETHRQRPCARKHGKAKRRCIRSHRRKARTNHDAGRTR